MDDRTPPWGIDPVPERLRTLGLLDQLALWGNLGVSLLVLVIGALLVPALTLRDALLAILVGGLIGNAMVGTAGLIGADARVPSICLASRPARPARLVRPDRPERRPVPRVGDVRADHHRRGRERALRRALRLRGEGRLDDLRDPRSRLRAARPVGFVRRILRRFGVWIVLASLVYLSWWALSEADLSALWNAPAEGGLVLARRRPRDRDHRLVGAARLRLHALLARSPLGVLGLGVGYFLGGT